MLSCSHTHSGPYTVEIFQSDTVDEAYLSLLPNLIAGSIEKANASLQLATMHVGRSLVHQGLHHRRVLLKNTLALNSWMVDALDDLDTCPQVIGASGPIDPELWVVRFDDLSGQPFGVFFNFTLHTNSHFGLTWSADYPGVVAEYMRHAFGPGVATVYTPGACADINPTMGGKDRWRQGAEYIAEAAVAAARRAKKIEGRVAVDATRRDVTVPRRDPESQPAGAVERLNWGGGRAWEEVFQHARQHVEHGPAMLEVPVNAARIGPFAIASNAGELFVEWGLAIKQRSPFPYTVVAELTNDHIGYEPTREAFQQQGYETLVGANQVSLAGIEALVDTAVQLLDALWQKDTTD
jgi:hypothetical protein